MMRLMHFTDRLTEAALKKSPICVGLDPVMAKMPEGIPRDPDGILMFCKGMVDVSAPIACCIKPNLAFFEIFGWEGMKVFFEVCEYAQKANLMVIADGKRGDIGSTCDAYAEAYLGKNKPIDALTVHPYLGSDGIHPFTDRAAANDKGIFVLVKTSNPSSVELQDLPVGDEVVHEHMAQLVESWATQQLGTQTRLSCVGAVVGATYPEEMTYLRTLMPHVPFLIPGYGAQGGTAEDAARGFLSDGTGAIVSASRSILYASSEADWKEAAEKALLHMAKDLQSALKKK